MLNLHRRRFAELLGKKPGASFNHSLDDALHRLQAVGVLCGHHRKHNDIEIHLSKEYLKMLETNPWFIPMKYVPTDSMCALCLRLWLGMQSGRHNYAIGLDKLKKHIGMTVATKYDALLAINKALEQIPWAKMEVDESLRFTLGSRPPAPIRTLRAILEDSLDQAR